MPLEDKVNSSLDSEEVVINSRSEINQKKPSSFKRKGKPNQFFDRNVVLELERINDDQRVTRDLKKSNARFLLLEDLIPWRSQTVQENAVAQARRSRLAETEARLERARAREAELNRRLEEMKRFISVMEILETYLKRRFRERQAQLSSQILSVPKSQ
ncbi:PREDICTED: uncharacterized protein LOC104611971 [Nelumbo nucifera]|uniref:Uncharacterized protein LOC104611971 n=1 Tax=Nelumbo nucifera TaxID=4432 RepID=A0A1U8B8X7_NELNU|nr:PREDICTED: uncharacterized protein LOC104611971 [Nelumbo nucifera]